MTFLKKIALKYLPVSRKRHNRELDQLRSGLIRSHERELQKIHKDLDELMPKFVRISLKRDDYPPIGFNHTLQIMLNEHMMYELNEPHSKECIARAIGRMVEYEISKLHYVFHAR